jgi:hypothetical protein
VSVSNRHHSIVSIEILIFHIVLKKIVAELMFGKMSCSKPDDEDYCFLGCDAV